MRRHGTEVAAVVDTTGFRLRVRLAQGEVLVDKELPLALATEKVVLFSVCARRRLPCARGQLKDAAPGQRRGGVLPAWVVVREGLVLDPDRVAKGGHFACAQFIVTKE